jgi:signal transduction histidine kinase
MSASFSAAGIGLATVQRIINKHGGRTWAKAAPGEGATFFFVLSKVTTRAILHHRSWPAKGTA